MRIDKYLWSVRFYKTRTQAAEEIKKNRVSVNGSVAKSSKEVKAGDMLEIRKNRIDYRISVIDIPKSRVGAKLVSQYAADKTDPAQYEILKMQREQQSHYRGEGRPTKKDRREIDGFGENISDDDGDGWDDFFSNGSSRAAL